MVATGGASGFTKGFIPNTFIAARDFIELSHAGKYYGAGWEVFSHLIELTDFGFDLSQAKEYMQTIQLQEVTVTTNRETGEKIISDPNEY